MGTSVSQDKFSAFILRTLWYWLFSFIDKFCKDNEYSNFLAVRLAESASYACNWYFCSNVDTCTQCRSLCLLQDLWLWMEIHSQMYLLFFVLLLWMNSNGKRFAFIHCVLEQVSVFIIQLHTDRYFYTTGLHPSICLQIYVNMCLFFCPWGKSCLIILHSFFGLWCQWTCMWLPVIQTNILAPSLIQECILLYLMPVYYTWDIFYLNLYWANLLINQNIDFHVHSDTAKVILCVLYKKSQTWYRLNMYRFAYV